MAGAREVVIISENASIESMQSIMQDVDGGSEDEVDGINMLDADYCASPINLSPGYQLIYRDVFKVTHTDTSQ